MLEFDKNTFKLKIKSFANIKEIPLTQVFQETHNLDSEIRKNDSSSMSLRKQSFDEKDKNFYSSKKRPQSSNGNQATLNPKKTIKRMFQNNYETAYKGFRFLSESMKTKMKNFREEIIKNRTFSATKINQFSLCYPPAERIRKVTQAELNVFPMILLEDYEKSQNRNLNEGINLKYSFIKTKNYNRFHL